MSALEHLVINLEYDIDEQYQYQPGEILRGHISMFLSRPVRIRTVFLNIKGEGNVAWEDATDHMTYQAREAYIDMVKTIVEYKNGDALSLTQGRHEFAFEYQLPENLPSSYIGKFGNVTYVIKATAQGEKPIDSMITSEPFLIMRRSPLPQDVMKRVEISIQKKLFGVFSFGKIKVKAAVDSAGAIPGEDMLIEAEVQNKSPKTITAIQGSIVMLSSYHAQKVTNNFRQIINRRRDDVELTKHQGRNWQNVRLTVPPYIPETRLEYCDIIDISYMFQFRVEISGGGDIKIEIPLMIGAAPRTLELPDVNTLHRINRTWKDQTVNSFHSNSFHGNSFHGNSFHSNRLNGYASSIEDLTDAKDENDYETTTWEGNVVPEMRMGSEVKNPLFVLGDGGNVNGNYSSNNSLNKTQINHIDSDGPTEIIESTDL